jgi:hypothetical protein
MNADDPNLTAFALNELEPHEHAQFAQYLRENPQAESEVEGVRTLATILNTTLQNEPSEGLSAKHRDHVLRVAGVQKPRPLPENIVDAAPWWKNWQAAFGAAACAVFGFGAYAIYDSLTEPRPKYTSAADARIRPDGIVVGVPASEPERPVHSTQIASAPREHSGANATAEVKHSRDELSAPAPKVAISPMQLDGKLAPPAVLPQISPSPKAVPAVPAKPETEIAATTPVPKKRNGQKPAEPMAAFGKPKPAPKDGER